MDATREYTTATIINRMGLAYEDLKREYGEMSERNYWLLARVAELEALLEEARDNALASTAEKDISDERRAYRRNLCERLEDAALAAEKGDKHE